ncbi:MAG: bifunctional (p)ppGpp synthetase/guanosine-3',5'-bis(diphosphate) 3'-pyrophosphohydrolase, partial [Candidatus Dadabacteria bacterium]
MESDRLARALALAVGCHRKQRRKGSRLPYLTHPLAVAAAIASCSDDENLLLAAILHDAAECGGGEAVLDLIGEQLGPAVARLVRSASILGQNTD